MWCTQLSRKIKCLIWYHNNEIFEQGKWCRSQLLIQPSKNSVYQDRSMVIPVCCQAVGCKLSKQRNHDLCHFAFQGLIYHETLHDFHMNLLRKHEEMSLKNRTIHTLPNSSFHTSAKQCNIKTS